MNVCPSLIKNSSWRLSCVVIIEKTESGANQTGDSGEAQIQEPSYWSQKAYVAQMSFPMHNTVAHKYKSTECMKAELS
jgi:hypothetical protein